MSEYIEREAAKEAVVKAVGKGHSPFNAIVMLPAADVRPVVRGKMKVDSACIDHNVGRLVGEITCELYEWTDNDRMMATALGEIRGIHQLAEALKEVLRA